MMFVEFKKCVKYLGVLVDSIMDWSSHEQLVRTKLSHVIFPWIFYLIGVTT